MATNRLDNLEARLTAIEDEMATIKADIAEAKTARGIMQDDLVSMKNDTAKILDFLTGVDKIGGMARRHWRTILTFGCGIMTAAGLGNPDVIEYVRKFFGLI